MASLRISLVAVFAGCLAAGAATAKSYELVFLKEGWQDLALGYEADAVARLRIRSRSF